MNCTRRSELCGEDTCGCWWSGSKKQDYCWTPPSDRASHSIANQIVMSLHFSSQPPTYHLGKFLWDLSPCIFFQRGQNRLEKMSWSTTRDDLAQWSCCSLHINTTSTSWTFSAGIIRSLTVQLRLCPDDVDTRQLKYCRLFIDGKHQMWPNAMYNHPVRESSSALPCIRTTWSPWT